MHSIIIIIGVGVHKYMNEDKPTNTQNNQVISSFSCMNNKNNVLRSTPYFVASHGSETGVQQGDPLGPVFFCLVLHKLVTAIITDNECSSLLFHRWYIDDGVVAGPKQRSFLSSRSWVLHLVFLSMLENVSGPNSWHFGPFEWNLRASAARAAALAWQHDLLKMAEWSGEVMVRSSAAGLPLSQPAIRMSVGLVWARSLVRP